MICNELLDAVKNVLQQHPDPCGTPASPGDPSKLVIQLLSPYISQQTSNIGSQSDVKSRITNFVKETIRSTKEEQMPAVIDELEHLVSHYAKRKDEGHIIADCILEGLTEALKTAIGPIKHFNNISKVRQAYWDRLQYSDPNPHRMHRTIRINGMPFAEGALVYLMAHYAYEYAIDLKIIDIAWGDVGAALLTNRVDIAFYNQTIEEQMEGLHRLADNRQVFRTKQAFTYRGYYFLSRANSIPCNPDLSAINKRVAFVSNSDHEKVFRDWYKNESAKLYSGRVLSRYRSKPPLQTIMVPVDSPDEALRAVVDEDDVGYCIGGGIHKEYAKNAFKGFIQHSDMISSLPPSTEVFFWAVSARRDDSEPILNDMISLWARVKKDWQTVKTGLGTEVGAKESLQSKCVKYVNRQPNKAFVTNSNGQTPSKPEDIFGRLAELIDKHNELCDLPVGEIAPVPIKGW